MAAIRSQQIGMAHDADIKTMLKYVMLKIGLRANNIPVEIEMKVLLDHVRKNYFNNHIDEIRLAFDMAISEELDMSTDDVKCYENFSCAYFSRIMNAYLSWAANEYKQLKIDPPKEIIYTDEQLDNFHRKWTEEFYQQLRNGQQQPLPDYVRGILLKDGFIREDQTATAFFVYCLGKGIIKLYEEKS